MVSLSSSILSFLTVAYSLLILHFHCKRDFVKVYFPTPVPDSWKTITGFCVFSAGNKQEEGIMNLKWSVLHLDGKNISNN